MKIKLNTTFTPYTKETIIKPKHALWTIRNNNAGVLLINEDFLLPGNGTLGVDALKILVPVIQHYIDTGGKEKIEIENDTQFSITIPKGYLGYGVNFTLIETSFEIIP